MWFGSIERMNHALSVTQEWMSVPGDMTSVRTAPPRFGLLFLPGGKLPSRTMLSRFGLPSTQCQNWVALGSSDIARMQRMGRLVAEGRMYGETACMQLLCLDALKWCTHLSAKPPI